MVISLWAPPIFLRPQPGITCCQAMHKKQDLNTVTVGNFQGFLFKFPTNSPIIFIWESPPAGTYKDLNFLIIKCYSTNK